MEESGLERQEGKEREAEKGERRRGMKESSEEERQEMMQRRSDGPRERGMEGLRD